MFTQEQIAAATIAKMIGQDLMQVDNLSSGIGNRNQSAVSIDPRTFLQNTGPAPQHMSDREQELQRNNAILINQLEQARSQENPQPIPQEFAPQYPASLPTLQDDSKGRARGKGTKQLPPVEVSITDELLTVLKTIDKTLKVISKTLKEANKVV